MFPSKATIQSLAQHAGIQLYGARRRPFQGSGSGV